MAVFRVEKTKDFTIMCNHHLRNTELSLKAKGLLSLMLSLPDMEIEDKRTVYGECLYRLIPSDCEPSVCLMNDWICLPSA